MWTAGGYGKLSPSDKNTLEKDAAPFGKDVKFRCFDGNNEPHFHIAHYIINDLERFSHFTGRELNSHHPSIEGYLRMYEVFEPLRSGLHSRSLNLAPDP